MSFQLNDISHQPCWESMTTTGKMKIDAAWLIGTLPQMGLVLISVMAVTGDGVDLRHVHSPALCPHAGGRVMLIDKRDRKHDGRNQRSRETVKKRLRRRIETDEETVRMRNR